MKNYPNMSYYQFHNTAAAMEQCIDSIDEHIEENGRLDDFEDFLSLDEKRGYKKMLDLAERLLDESGRLDEIIEENS